MVSSARCLVTGASGYIGGRLVPELLAAGNSVRCMARDPGKLSDRPWSAQVEIMAADALDRSGVRQALDGIDVAYYLIHSLGTGVPTAALQAAVIIGSGSASFEMLRYLTERLPAMVTPMWVDTRIQPIAVRDVLRYLVGAASLPSGVSRRFDIGGPDVLTYADMMRRYAAVAGLPPRVLIRVPVLTPQLSAHWVGLVTPVPSGLAKPLVESLRNEVVASEHDIAGYLPDPPGGLLPLDQAIALALRHTREGDVSTSWTSAGTPGAPSDPLPS